MIFAAGMRYAILDELGGSQKSFLLELCKLQINCPLSLWERVRVRAVGGKMYFLDYFLSHALTPAPLPKGEGSNVQKTVFT